MLTIVTGGSGSGKSAFAEDKVLAFGEAQRVYIATMHPFDEESHKRIERHRKMRAGKGFETIECYVNLKEQTLPEKGVVLLECMSNLTANEMFEPEGAGDGTGDLGDLEGMGQAGCIMVALGCEEDLRLMLESSEGLTMENPVAVTLEAGTDRAGRLGPDAPLGRG